MISEFGHYFEKRVLLLSVLIIAIFLIISRDGRYDWDENNMLYKACYADFGLESELFSSNLDGHPGWFRN
jgi:hypothetical protein